ncbi:MAG: signal peptidase I [Acidimicrobiia bacterium]
MTATTHTTLAGTAASSGRLSSVASGVLEFVWPMYLTLVFTLGAWVLVPTVVLGWQPVTIISGSMAPTVAPGHVVVVEPYAGQDLSRGTVVTFRDTSHDRLVTHRVAAVDEDGTITTKGDANAVDDQEPLATDRIVGVGRLVIPAAGLPSLWMHQGRTDLLAVVVVLTVLSASAAASAVSTGMRSLRPRLSLRGGTSRRARRRTIGFAFAALAVSAALGGTAVSRAAFVGSQDNATNTFTAGMVGSPTGLSGEATCVLLVSLLTGPAVNLSWTGAPGATGYDIVRTKADGSGRTSMYTSGTSFRDEDGLVTSTTYHYSVHARAGSWTGGSVGPVAVKTPLLCVL